MKLFAGSSNLNLANEIADYVGTPLGKVTIDKFSDGELSVAFEENIRNEDVFIIQSTNSPNDNIWELLLMLDAAKRASARQVIAVIPYFGYGRQDRKDRPRVPITARLKLDLITFAGVDRIVTMDLHSPQIQGFVNIPFDHLYSSIALADFIKKFNFEHDSCVVLAPDAGSVNLSRAYAKRLKVGFAMIDKRRPKPNQTEVVNLIGDLENKHVIIIDDMIDTAGTICNAAATANQKGAKEVIVIATHPVLSGPAIRRLENSLIKKIFLCNTIEVNKEKMIDKIELISIAHVFGEAIKRIVDGRSLSSMFNF